MHVRIFLLTFLTLANATVAFAQDTARYKLEIFYSWSAETHPIDFPAAGHISKIVGATHTSRYVLFEDGRTPTGGLRLIAENGRDTILLAEFAEGQRRKRVGTVFEGPKAGTVPSTISFEFDAQAAHPYLSFVSMLAPSPDWFTGASAIPLRQDEAWIETVTLPLWAWDAGTDSGTTYRAKNAETQPHQSVRLLSTEHFLGADGLLGVGQMVLTRLP